MSGVQDVDWAAIAAPVTLAGTAVVVLLVDAFAGPDRRTSRLSAVLTVLGVAGAAVPALLLWADPRGTFCIADAGCSFVVDDLTLVFWGITLFGTAVVTLLGTLAVSEGRTPPGEWCFLLLCSATGALVLAASRDLVTLVVALEVVSLPAFALAGLHRGDLRGAEAAVKFFLVSVISTGVMLMGVSLLYGATGAVFLDGIDEALVGGVDAPGVAAVGTLLTVVGLAFKVAAVPFHMWVPDTYVGAPVAVAAYLSVVSKAAGFAGLLLVLALGLPELADVWAPIIAVLAALTMTVGNLLALRQKHAVRLLAWSSVAQAGYILVPFGAVETGAAALGASAGYLAIYAVVNLGAFSVATVVGAAHPAQRLADYRGLVRERPLLGWPLAFALLGLAGLPPGVAGLFAKVVVFEAAAGPVTWLAVVMAANVAIGLVYYALWMRELFLPAEHEAAPSYDVRSGAAFAVLVTFAAAVALSVLPGLVLDPIFAALG